MEFIDTNILVYAASGAPADRRKANLARDLLRRGGFAISLQVLQEFYVAATHPKKLGLTPEEALAYCTQWRRLTVLEPTLELFEEAVRIARRFRIGYYDAAILAAAHQLRCRTLFSEDLAAGQEYEAVRVVNPFG